MSDDRKRSLPRLVLDFGAVVVLAACGYGIYHDAIVRAPLSMDGFILTALLHDGRLPVFTPGGPKDPGRPLLAAPWHLARWTFGGSVKGYNTFCFLCIVLNSVLFYAVLRAARVPRFWAFWCAALKLSWPGNALVWENFELSVHFAESGALVAALLLTTLVRHPVRGASRILAYTGLLVALAVAVGIYQPYWGLVLLAPLVIVGALPSDQRRFVNPAVLTWYGWAGAWMLGCTLASRGYVKEHFTGVLTILERTGIGTKAALWNVFVTPVEATPRIFDLDRPVMSVGLLSALAIALAGSVVWYADSPAFVDPKRARVALLGSLCAVVLVVLPPSLQFVPAYGSRFLQSASFGSVGCLAAVLALTVARWRRGALPVVTGLLGLVVFTGASQLLFDGHRLAARGDREGLFWRELTREVPGIPEDAAVVFREPLAMKVDEYEATWILRELTATSRTFLLCQGRPTLAADGGIHTVTVLDLDEPDGRSRVQNPYSGRQYLPVPTATAKHTVDLGGRPLVLVHRDATEHLKVKRGREVIIWDHPSAYGAELFPQ